MKFFYLAHSKMSYVCLKDLISKNYIPKFIVIHKNYEYEKLEKDFFSSIEELCFQNKTRLFKVNSINEINEEIKNFDVGLCVGFMEILKRDIFDLPKYGILNLHCGQLPKYRGRAPISRTIINDEKYLTLTLHKINGGVDSGDICNEMKMEIKEEDDVNSLYKKCSESSSNFVIDSLNKLENGKLEFVKQNITSRPNKKISDQERRINWNKSAREVFNLIRAITLPYPAAYSNYKGNELSFLEAQVIKTEGIKSEEAGKICEVNKNYLLINCNDNLLKVKKILDKDFMEIDYLNTFIEGEFFK